MTWFPIAFYPPQFEDSSGNPYSGAVLKAYAAGTTTVISMATSYLGSTTASSFALNASGYPVSGGAVIIPHVQENYKLALYPTQAAADANTGALWTYDDVQIEGSASTTYIEGAAHKTPGGRLTLTSGTPVLVADTLAATTIYYTYYVHDRFPLYNGTNFIQTMFTELSLPLDSDSGHTGYHQSGKNFDLFLIDDSGTIKLASGPAWTSDTGRGTGAGTTELERKNGVWTNKVTITLRTGTASGATVSVAANRATYVGSFRATANGQTGMAFNPTAASGGTANVLGLYNAYNRVNTKAMCRDNTASWTYATTTWRSANNSASNRISFIDGLKASSVDSTYIVENDNSGGAAGIVGSQINSTSTQPNICGQGTQSAGQCITVRDVFNPVLGFNFIQALEYATGATATFRAVLNSQPQQALIVALDM